MRSLWIGVLLASSTLDLSSAILLPENVIPSVTITHKRRQAASQCSQTVIPVTMSCTTPSPAKRQEATSTGGPSPAGVVIRDAPTPICSQIYITSEKCSDASGPDYAGTTMTIPPSNTIPGLPGGTTGTIETAALSAGVCPPNTKSPWEVQMTPELRDRILDIANDVCNKNGNPVHRRQGSEYLNHPQCDFHAMGSKPQQEFIAAVKAEIQPKVYYPFDHPSDLDCLPEGWADYPHHEQLVADVVAAFIGYAFDLGWNLWETFNVPAEFGSSAMAASSTESETSSGSSSTVFDKAGDPPTKSTSSSSSTWKPGPGPKQSSTTTTSTSSEADACPTDISIDPDEDQGQDGPTPTDQIVIVPTGQIVPTITAMPSLACDVHLDKVDHECNVCTCFGKDTTMTVPLSFYTYQTTASGTVITTIENCWYTEWPDTKTVSTTSCMDPHQIAQSLSLQSGMESISKHLYPSDYTPGAPVPTCSLDPKQRDPICDMRRRKKGDDLPDRYCECPGVPGPTPTTPRLYNIISDAKVTSCDIRLGTVTHVDVCPWTTTPPESLRIHRTLTGSPYPRGTMPPVAIASPSCNPVGRRSEDPNQCFEREYLRSKVDKVCKDAVANKWSLGRGTKDTFKEAFFDDAGAGRNSVGKPRPKYLEFIVVWDERACPEDFDDDHYEFRDIDDCKEQFMRVIDDCPHANYGLPLNPGSVKWYNYAGGMYDFCLWWEIGVGDKYFPKNGFFGQGSGEGYIGH